mgnify:FL=1
MKTRFHDFRLLFCKQYDAWVNCACTRAVGQFRKNRLRTTRRFPINFLFGPFYTLIFSWVDNERSLVITFAYNKTISHTYNFSFGPYINIYMGRYVRSFIITEHFFSLKFGLKIFISRVKVKQVPIYVEGQLG